jgi:AraC-like DNA-binding protein
MDQASTTASGPEHGRPRLSRAVRDALRFVHAHARDPISVPDIAAAAHLSTRGLQSAFRRELGASPAAYLRGVRLEGVRRDLHTMQPSDRQTIADVAKRWHFSNAGRMAAEYRAVFGSAPSAALRYFDPEDPGPEGSAPLTGPPSEGTRFRIVLDCEVEVEDAEATLASALRRADHDDRSWHGYDPHGSTADLVAFILAGAVRGASGDASGIRLRAVNPMLRMPDDRGAYPAAELPAWWGPDDTPSTIRVRSRPQREATDD